MHTNFNCSCACKASIILSASSPPPRPQTKQCNAHQTNQMPRPTMNQHIVQIRIRHTMAWFFAPQGSQRLPLLWLWCKCIRQSGEPTNSPLARLCVPNRGLRFFAAVHHVQHATGKPASFINWQMYKWNLVAFRGLNTKVLPHTTP